jgi:poly-gamma-glutamate capsule biosynthesis protein CapA/YwtB (metallophosphatase superfamily)
VAASAAAALLIAGFLAACGGGGGSGAATAAEQSTSTNTSATNTNAGASSTSTATTATHTAKPKPKPVKLTVEVNGDILVHSPVWQQALADGHGNYDFRPMLREIRPYIKGADLAICHIETPMTPRPPQGYPVFNTPTQLAAAIHWAGYRICDTASNHSVDMGQYGIDETGRALNRAGVLHTGSFPSPSASRRILITKVKGIKVAFLAFTEMTNGIPLPHSWSVNLAHVDAVERDARAARRAGAQVVIVNFHWGDEFVTQPSAFQLDLARRLTADSDITAIVGQHVHIVQPIERLGGKLVVFGEGQILSNQSSACCPVQSEDGMLVFLHITVRGNRSSLAGISYIPTWNRHPDYTVLPIGDALKRHEESAGVLQASYHRTTATVGRIPHLLGPIPGRLP